MMTEDASAARSARGARPLDLKARIRSQRSGEGKGGDLEAGGIFGWTPLSQVVRGEAFRLSNRTAVESSITTKLRARACIQAVLVNKPTST